MPQLVLPLIAITDRISLWLVLHGSQFTGRILRVELRIHVKRHRSEYRSQWNMGATVKGFRGQKCLVCIHFEMAKKLLWRSHWKIPTPWPWFGGWYGWLGSESVNGTHGGFLLDQAFIYPRDKGLCNMEMGAEAWKERLGPGLWCFSDQLSPSSSFLNQKMAATVVFLWSSRPPLLLKTAQMPWKTSPRGAPLKKSYLKHPFTLTNNICSRLKAC